VQYGVDWLNMTQGPVVGTCEHCSETSGSIKGGNFLTIWSSVEIRSSMALVMKDTLEQRVSTPGPEVACCSAYPRIFIPLLINVVVSLTLSSLCFHSPRHNTPVWWERWLWAPDNLWERISHSLVRPPFTPDMLGKWENLWRQYY
jgi:hypothetical protein